MSALRVSGLTREPWFREFALEPTAARRAPVGVVPEDPAVQGALGLLGSRGEAIEASQPESLEWMARYATRAPIALARVFVQKDGRTKLLTPVHPQGGKDYVIFDPLDWVAASHILRSRVVAGVRPKSLREAR